VGQTVRVTDRHADLDLALEMADRADEITMATFTGRPLDHETKADGSPVTETDRRVERALRDLVARARPDDGFLGEETGAVRGRTRRWIVDPIDGTRSFIAGGSGWCTLIALEADLEVSVGVSSAPVLGRRWWGAAGTGAYARTSGASQARPFAVSPNPGLDQASWSCNPSLEVFAERAPSLAERLSSCGRYVVPTMHPVLMVAEGIVDVCVQLFGEPWDYAGFAGIVQAAGGAFSYLDGTVALSGNRPGLFTNGRVHRLVLQRLHDGRG
jgi:histidinol-phosphatase